MPARASRMAPAGSAAALVLAVVLSSLAVAPAHAAPLLGASATEAARTDPAAAQPVEACEATVSSAAELSAVVSASGTGSVVCLSSAWTGGIASVVVERDVVIDAAGATLENPFTLDIAADRHLQLVDRAATPGKVEVAGIHVPPTASLVVWSGDWSSIRRSAAGIGGDEGEASGEIVIRGGTVYARSTSEGAGIGGGRDGDAGPVTIWGGTVTASSGLGAAIGGGRNADGGQVTIHGGTVRARAWGGGCSTPFCIPTSAAGIGGGADGDGGVVLITGGTVVAEGLNGIATGAGIGSGGQHVESTAPAAGTVTITGGTVTARSSVGAGIGGGSGSPGGVVSITGGTVVAETSQASARAVGGGGVTAGGFGGSLSIGAEAVVTLSALPPAPGHPSGPVFGGTDGTNGFDSLIIDGRLTIGSGTLAVPAPGSGGANTVRVGPSGVVAGPGAVTVFGAGIGVIDNQGAITAPVDPASLRITGNHYRLAFGAVASDVRVYAPTLAAGARSFPAVAGVVAWTRVGQTTPVEGGTSLEPLVTSGSRATGDATVALEPIAGSARLTLAPTARPGEAVIPVFERVDADGVPLALDDAAHYAVTGPGGTDVTAEVLTPDGALVFLDGGRYTVTATSAATGYAHLSDSATLDVLAAPTIPAATPPAAVSGEGYTFAPVVTGHPAPTVVLDSPPPGLAFEDGILSGVPTRAGEFPFTVTASNSEGNAEQSFVLSVGVGAPAVLELTAGADRVLDGGTLGFEVSAVDDYGQDVVLAPGDVVLASSAASDVVTGTSIVFSGTGSRIVTAALVADPAVSATVAVAVVTAPTFASVEPPVAVSGVPYVFDPGVGGIPAPVVLLEGELPTGLAIEDGVVAGTPEEAGTFAFTLVAENPGGRIERDYVIDVSVGAPVGLVLELPAGVTARQGGSVTFRVSGLDAYGQTVDVTGAVVLSSDVATDVIDGLTVRFPHASPHRITATLRDDPLVRAMLLVEVAAAPAALGATGADAGGIAGIGLLALLAGAALSLVRLRARRS